MKPRRLPGAAPGSIVIAVHAKPRSPASALQRQPDGTWVARLVSPPIDGKANEELVSLVARHFGCAKSAVSVKSGASGRIKRVRIDGVPAGLVAPRDA
ncbi:MAG: hypothetical protein LKCHEGNO_02579 [Burkholderiaceae bacterium]|nr:hypothetical protein [Burkholderiaceae bacterium]